MSDDFNDDAFDDAQLAQTVEHALRGLGIAASRKDEASLRSAVAALGGRATPAIAAPSLAADLHGEARDDSDPRSKAIQLDQAGDKS